MGGQARGACVVAGNWSRGRWPLTLFRDEFASIEKFLGIQRASGSPFDLLGVPPRDLTAAEVVSGLEARLLELERHPESRTPPADEVRLALHAAAAQMLDPSTRDSLIEHWKNASNGAWNEEVAPSPMASAIGTPAKLALEGDAVMAMALEGGWNARSLERLMMFAHARNLTADDVAHVVQRLSHPGAAPVKHEPRPATSDAAPAPRGPGLHQETPAARTPPPRPRTFELTEDEIRKQSEKRLRAAMIGIGCGSVVLFAVTLGVIAAFRTTPPPDAETAPRPPVSSNPPASTPRATNTTPPTKKPDAPPDWTSADEVVRQLASAAGEVREKPADASRRFATAFDHAGRSWPRWKADELAAVQDGVVEYLYRVARDTETLRAAAEAISAPAKAGAAAKAMTPAEVSAAVWSVGICTRVLRERDLPAGVTGPARLAAAEFVGSESDLADGTFAGGVNRALAASVPRLVAHPSVDSWRTWLNIVGVVSPEPAARGRTIVAALDAMLLSRANPLDEPLAVESIGVLAAALTWRPDEQSRGWMFRWFDSAAVSTPALHALTAALASRSGAEGVDSSMVLSAAASPGQRSELRARYASAWSETPGGLRSDLRSKWLAAATRELEPAASSETNNTPTTLTGDLAPRLAMLVNAITVSRLCEAAGWIVVGDTAKPAAIVGEPGAGIADRAKVLGPNADPLGGTNDGAWAIRYLSSLANGPVRLEMLKQAEAAPELTALECEVVATEAIRGLPASVRQAARRVVVRHRLLPGMLNAMLALAPTIAASPDNHAFIQELTGGKLPALRDSRWKEVVRRQLVEQLLERAAGRGEFGAVDAMAELLGQSYRERIASLGGADGLPPEIDGPALAKLAAIYRSRWDREAERTPPTGKEHASLGQIRQRAAGRAGLASNIVQQFVAEQTVTVELMAYVIVAESPARADAVAAVVNAWIQSRRQSKHIFEQIQVAEHAMLKLWRIRMQETAA